MTKRFTLLELLRTLPPASSADDCLAYAPDTELLRRDIARQRKMWEETRKLARDNNDGPTLDLGLFAAEEEQSAPCWAGCDEVGRGPLAGPLAAAAVILPEGAYIPGLRDSKQLTHAERLAMVPWIKAQAQACAIAEIGLDELNGPLANINSLSLEGMTRALRQLDIRPSWVFVDGRCRLPGWDGPQKALIKGDDRCPAIAAASVLAKVHRDLLMTEADKRWPQYGFADNKGYGTAQHMRALREHGVCAWHRMHYRPVQEILERQE